MSLTRRQIISTLKERGWMKKRNLWYASKGHFKSIGVSLRDAASVEMLNSSENLDTPKRRAQ